MGVIRWTGKRLQLTGRILTAGDVEAWIAKEGERPLEATMKKLTLRWFRGRKRAERMLFRELSRVINASKPFRLALENSLTKLPEIIEDFASWIHSNGPRELGDDRLFRWLAVVPRALVQNEYRLQVLSDLGDSVELARFTGLADLFLQTRARESEEEFFKTVRKVGFYVCNYSMIIEVDSDFDWQLSGAKGHYFAASSPREDLSAKRMRRKFQKGISEHLLQRKVALGSLGAQHVRRIRDSLVGALKKAAT